MKSEFAALSDLLISQGVAHSELLFEIHQTVLTEFRLRYPKLPIGATVVVDEITGEVRIFSGAKDITPKDFADEASVLARKVIIDRLGNVQRQPQAGSTKPHVIQAWKNNVALSWLSNIYFWGYNLYFLVYGLITEASWLTSLFKGNILENLRDLKIVEVFVGFVLLATPVTAIVLTLKRKLYEKPGALGRIFFLFEIPVFLVASVPMVFGTTATPFLQFSTLALLGIPIILYFFAIDNEIGVMGKKVLLFIQQTSFLVVSYFTLLFSFFVPLILGSVGKSLFGDIFPTATRYGYGGYYQPPVFESVLQLGFGLLIFALAVLMISLPYLLVLVLSRAMRKTFASLAETVSAAELTKMQAIFALVIILIAGATSYQGNNWKLLEQLDKAVTSKTFADQEMYAEKLIPQEKRLEQIIKNYSKDKMGYWFGKDDKTLASGYRYVFDAEILGQSIQEVFLKVAYPLVFQGKDISPYYVDGQFQYLFGRSVYETKIVTPATADKSVRLSYRKVNVTTDKTGIGATVSIEEEFENRTTMQQEVIYEFSLPAGSVVTELNLGPDLEFPGVISPKGAAQRTYEAQLQVRRDPALLEQVGPDQYRLRVFPIPASTDYTTLKGRLQKVQYAYATPITKEGYGLPTYYKMNNLLVNNAVPQLLTINNSAAEQLKEGQKFVAWKTKDQICSEYPATSLTYGALTAIISANNRFGCVSDAEVLKAINGIKIGVLFDVSAANKGNKALDEMKKLFGNDKFLERNTVYFYKYNEKISDGILLSNDNLSVLSSVKFFGKSSIFSAATNLKEQFDLVIVVTSNKADMSSAMNYPFKPNASVYIVQHGQIPAYHSKLSTYLIQGDGGTVSTVADALRDVITKKDLRMSGKQGMFATLGKYVTATVLIADGSDLLDVPIRSASGSSEVDRGLINQAMLRIRMGVNSTDVTTDVKIMDRFNEFAKTAGIVTPFSSYIALVNEQQRQQLEQFEESYNRYQEQSIITNNNFGRIVTPPVPMAEDRRQIILNSPLSGITGSFGAMERSAPAVTGGMMLNPSLDASVDSVGFAPLTSFGSSRAGNGNMMFLLLNGVVMGVGLLWYLVKLLRGQNPRK